jgi:hypothetical protein
LPGILVESLEVRPQQFVLLTLDSFNPLQLIRASERSRRDDSFRQDPADSGKTLQLLGRGGIDVESYPGARCDFFLRDSTRMKKGI